MAPLVRAEQPPDGDERSILTGWLAFHRDALAAKCHGLTDDQLVERAAEPSPLSLLGLVRHLAEMERAYGVWPLGPEADLEWVWGTYENGAEHDIDCDATTVEESMRAWRDEMRKTDEALARHSTLDEVGEGNGYSVRWNLTKLVGEYARHNGHADLIRERIDGQTGE
ncbi:MAG: DinB family protein [Microthrixaceae bacterium]